MTVAGTSSRHRRHVLVGYVQEVVGSGSRTISSVGSEDSSSEVMLRSGGRARLVLVDVSRIHNESSDVRHVT